MISIISSELEVIEKQFEQLIAGIAGPVMLIATFAVVHYYVRAYRMLNACRLVLRLGGDSRISSSWCSLLVSLDATALR